MNIKLLENFFTRSSDKLNSKWIVYFTVFNGYDVVPRNLPVIGGVKYLVITDAMPKNVPKNLEVIVLKERFGIDNPRMLAKVFKILPHRFLKDAEYSLYVDANCLLKIELKELFERFENGKFLFGCFKHNKRDCLYLEALECIRIGRGNSKKILLQVQDYVDKDYPANNGLYQGGFLLRKHNDLSIENFMNEWWEEICKYTDRDQISLPYVENKYNLPKLIVEGTLHNSLYTKIYPHYIKEYEGRLNFRILLHNILVFLKNSYS
jgi:hypothetical protein